MKQIFYRLMDGLPYYVQKPKPKLQFKDLLEYESELSVEGSLNNWRIMLVAQFDSGKLEDAVRIQESDSIAKDFLQKCGDVVLKPAIYPPSRDDILKWLCLQKKIQQPNKLHKTKTQKTVIEYKKDEIPAATNFGESPIKLQRSVSIQPAVTKSNKKLRRRRRVSFDLSNLCQQLNNKTTASPFSRLDAIPLSPLAQDVSASTNLLTTPKSIKKLKVKLQSTPLSSQTTQHKDGFKKLKFTPIKYDNSDVEIQTASPIISSTPKSVKMPSLRRKVLAGKYENVGEVTPRSVRKRSTSLDSPPFLETPHLSKQGSQIDGPSLDNSYGFKAKQEQLGEAKSLHIVQHLTLVILY